MRRGRRVSARDLMQRVGTVEWRMDVHEKADEKQHDDHESRLRKLEHLTAKVAGAALVGSALGGFILSTLKGCF